MREWRTPLNGGDGFGDEVYECRIKVTEANAFSKGQSYFCKAEQFHTINIMTNDAVLLINQFEDKIPLSKATHTFFKTDDKPTISGLYEKFKADEIISLLNKLGVK